MSTKKLVKIVALSCSPSKGFNSDNMLDAFLKGLAEVQLKVGDKVLQFEKIYLNDLEIANYSFLNRLPDPAKEPEFVELVEKVVSADGVVIATPTFNFGVPAALKNLLDRMSYKALNPKQINWLHQPTGQLTNIRAFYLVSCGTPLLLQKIGFFLFPAFWMKVVFWYFGAQTWGSVYGTGLNAKNLAKDNLKLMAKCQKAGRKYAERQLQL